MATTQLDDAFAEWRQSNKVWLHEAEDHDMNWDTYVSLLCSAFKAGWNSQKHMDKKLGNEIDEIG